MFPDPRPDWQRRWDPFFLAHKFLPENHQPSSKVVMFPEPRPDWQRRWNPFFLAHKFLPENHQPSSKVVMFPEPRTDPFFLTNEFIPQSPSYEERPTETENRNSEGTEKENRNKIDMDSVVPYPNLNCNFNVKYGTKYVNAVSALPNVRDTAKTVDNTPPRPPQGVIVDRVTPKQGHKIQDTPLYTIHLQYKIPETSYDILECVKIKESHQNIKVIDYQDKEFYTNANKYHDTNNIDSYPSSYANEPEDSKYQVDSYSDKDAKTFGDTYNIDSYPSSYANKPEDSKYQTEEDQNQNGGANEKSLMVAQKGKSTENNEEITPTDEITQQVNTRIDSSSSENMEEFEQTHKQPADMIKDQNEEIKSGLLSTTFYLPFSFGREQRKFINTNGRKKLNNCVNTQNEKDEESLDKIITLDHQTKIVKSGDQERHAEAKTGKSGNENLENNLEIKFPDFKSQPILPQNESKPRAWRQCSEKSLNNGLYKKEIKTDSNTTNEDMDKSKQLDDQSLLSLAKKNNESKRINEDIDQNKQSKKRSMLSLAKLTAETKIYNKQQGSQSGIDFQCKLNDQKNYEAKTPNKQTIVVPVSTTNIPSDSGPPTTGAHVTNKQHKMNDLFKNTNMVINQNAKNAKKSADPEPVLTAVGAQTEAAFWAVQCSAVQYSDVCQTGRLAKNVFIFSIYFCLAACTAKENVTGPFHLETEAGYYKKQYNNIYLFQIAPNLDLESTITNMRGEDGDQEAMYHTMDTIEGICTLTAPDHLQEDEIDSTGTKFDNNYITTDLYYKSGLYQVLSMFPYGNFQFKKLNFLYISHVTHGEIPAELTRSEGKTTNCDNAVADLATPLSLTLETTAGKELKVVGTAFEIPQSDRIENASGGISKQLSQTSAIFNLHCPTVPLSHFTTVLLSFFTTWTESYCSMYRDTNSNKTVGNLQVTFTQSEKTCYDEIANTISPSYNNLISNTGENLYPGRPMMTWDTPYYTTCSVYYDRPVVNYDISTNMDQFRGLGFRKEPGELGSAFTFLRPDYNHAVVNLVTNPSLGITANKKLEVVVGKEEPSLAASALLYAANRVAPGFSMVHGELHISFHLKSKLVITNPSPGVTAIKKPKVLEVARKDEKSGLTTSCLQTTRPMYSIIFTKAESTPKHHYHDIPLASQAYCLPHLHTWVRTCAPVVTMKRCPAQLSTISSPG